VRAGAGLLDVLAGRVAAGDVRPERVLDALRWRALHGSAGPGTAALDVADVDAEEMAWRRDGFPAGWEALLAHARTGLRAALDEVERLRSAMAEPCADPAEALLAALDALVPVPRPAGVDSAGRPRDPMHDAGVAAALEAREHVAALVRERVRAAARVGERPTPAQAAEELRLGLEHATFERRDRRLDVVHLLDPDTARSWEAPVVFLVGLDEGGLPHRSQEDPILGDDDRALLAGGAVALPTSAAHEARERRRLLTLLTRASRRLVLLRATRTPDGDDLPPSPLLGEILRVLEVAPRRPERGPVEGVPALARCRTATDHLRFAAAGAGHRAADSRVATVARGLLHRLDPDLARRASQWRRRGADVLSGADLARFEASVRRVSPSHLNAARACLQRHFLERVVGIPPDEAPLAGPRFGRRDLGKLLHAAFQRALEAPQEAAEDVAARVLAESRVSGFERVHAAGEIARSVRLLRAREADAAGPFAVATHWLERRLGGQEGVALGAGAGRFALVGRLDRVDLAGTRAVVVDYKLGAATPDEAVKRTLAGEDLQLPLYARALEREAGYQVVGLEWMASTRRARAAIVREDESALFAPRREGRAAHELEPEAFAALLETAERVAAGLVERIRAGAHQVEPLDARLCDECPMRGPCRPDRAHLRLVAAAAGRPVNDDEEDEET
jgi:hypothetical protein